MTPAPDSLSGVRLLILSGDFFAAEGLATSAEESGADLAVHEGLIDPGLASLAEVVLLHESLTGSTPRGDLVRFLEALPERVLAAGAGAPEAFDGLPLALTAAHPESALAAIEKTLHAPLEADPAVAIGAQGAEAAPASLAARGAVAEDGVAAGPPSPELAPAGRTARDEEGESIGRTLRAAVTVLVVTALLWLVFGRGGMIGRLRSPAEGIVPGTPLVDTGPAAAGTPGAPGTSGAPGASGAPGIAGLEVPGSSELAGRVVRSDTSGSIGGATVVATGPSGPVATITDGQGRWRFTGLRGGTYVVVSTVPRFAARQLQVEVPEGRTVENVNLSLDPEGA